MLRGVQTLLGSLALVLTIGAAGVAPASAAPVKYPTCKEMWKDYPAGVAMMRDFQRAAERRGYLMPEVDFDVYYDNSRNPALRGPVARDGVLCERPNSQYLLKDCAELIKRFPAGLTGSRWSASVAVNEGYLRPAVDSRWFGANQFNPVLRGPDGKSDVLCEGVDPRYDFADCSALRITYPGGVAQNEYVATAHESKGFIKPSVADIVYRKYVRDRQFWGADGDKQVLCETPRPAVAPAAVTGLRLGSFLSSGASMCSVFVEWKDDTTAYPDAKYDIFVNGVLVESAETLWFTSAPVQPDSPFTIEVVAYNEAGRSDASRITGQAPALQRCQGLKRVVYTVSGTAPSVDVTIENASGGTEQHRDLVNPTFEFWMRPGAFVYIAAYNNGQSGTVTCTITSNDRRVSTSTSSGAYVGATCSGSA